MKNNRSGPNNGRWKGGRKVNPRGYVLLWSPNHPRAMRGGYIYEHRLIMEKHLGRSLKKIEEVHHIDGNRQNNNIGNLRLFKNKAEHVSFERKQKRAIADIMKEVLIEKKRIVVTYGDEGLFYECAIRAPHTTLADTYLAKRRDRIYKALDKSDLFIKSKIRTPLLDGRLNYPVCLFTLQEFPEGS